MITIEITAEYNPDTDIVEIQLPAVLDSADVMIKRHKDELNEDVISAADPTWTEAELDEMLQFEAKTAAEIAASIREEGGGWEDLGITDGAEWSIEHRKKIEGRYKW
jgi:hypothetical protein